MLQAKALPIAIRPMIDVPQVLHAAPRFNRFSSVAELNELVRTLCAGSAGFEVTVAGTSAQGAPIHHVRFGTGRVKAMFTAFVDPDEPIGGMTAYSLLTLLRQGHKALADADVEWHIVPCADPDAAVLNEGWTLQPFTLENFMKNCYKQSTAGRVETTFPVRHKELAFDRPTREAAVLKGLLDRIRPDFYNSLHNAVAGGAFYLFTRDIGAKYYRQIHALSHEHGLPLETNAWHGFYCQQFAPGVYELGSIKKLYDAYERTGSAPEKLLCGAGASSADYLAEIHAGALGFISELPYVKHPHYGSSRQTSQNLRQLKLRMDADNKFIATMLLEEWDKVKADLDPTSPFYRKIAEGLASARETLPDFMHLWPIPTRDILFNPAYGRPATEGERFNEQIFRLYFLGKAYAFVRLLKASMQTPAVRQAIERLEPVFDGALAELEQNIDMRDLEVVDCNALMQVQLGSSLVVLNSVLESRSGGGVL